LCSRVWQKHGRTSARFLDREQTGVELILNGIVEAIRIDVWNDMCSETMRKTNMELRIYVSYKRHMRIFNDHIKTIEMLVCIRQPNANMCNKNGTIFELENTQSRFETPQRNNVFGTFVEIWLESNRQ
jgi:hypothetical protein